MERKSKRTMKIFVHSLFLFSYEASPRLYNKIEIDKGENKRIQKKAERKAKKSPTHKYTHIKGVYQESLR